MNHTTKTCDVDAMNQLLRGELSAVETYDQAIEKFAGKPGVSELKSIRGEHAHAVSSLQKRVMHFGGEPAMSSGLWGTFATAVTGTAKIFGTDTVVAALKKGEEHGISEYEKALANVEVHTECKELVRNELLPKCRTHVTQLDGLVPSKG